MRSRSMCGRAARPRETVRAGAGGETALRPLDDPDNVAALVADMHRPGMDGVELARRTRDEDPDLRILSLSARLHALGVKEPPKPLSHLRKPLPLDDLRKAVARLLQVSVQNDGRVVSLRKSPSRRRHLRLLFLLEHVLEDQRAPGREAGVNQSAALVETP
jgi:CheY-like chemotaxis protein